MDFVHQQYWDDSYNSLDIDFDITNDPVAKLISKILKVQCAINGEVLEIGCFPGRYLQVFGNYGFCLNGIDTTPKVTTELPELFKAKDYRVGSLVHGDVFNYSPAQKFDAVCSFGFIEHFKKWEDVVLLHLQHVKKNGLVFITVPNFRGFYQKNFHRFFDVQNLRRHNLNSMDTKEWKRVLIKNEIEFDVLFEGPFGEIEFWADEERRSRLKRFVMSKTLRFLNSLSALKFPPSRSYSPYLGLIIKVK